MNPKLPVNNPLPESPKFQANTGDAGDDVADSVCVPDFLDAGGGAMQIQITALADLAVARPTRSLNLQIQMMMTQANPNSAAEWRPAGLLLAPSRIAGRSVLVSVLAGRIDQGSRAVVIHIDSELIARESGVVSTHFDPDIVRVFGPDDTHIVRDIVRAGEVTICIAVVLFPAPGVVVMDIRWAIAGQVAIRIGQDFRIQSGRDCYRLRRIRLKRRRPISELQLRHRRRQPWQHRRPPSLIRV